RAAAPPPNEDDLPQNDVASGAAGADPQPPHGAAPSRRRGRQVPASSGDRARPSTSNQHSGNIHQRARKRRKREALIGQPSTFDQSDRRSYGIARRYGISDHCGWIFLGITAQVNPQQPFD
ncbi:MAG: hypothetical protein HC837_16430, partial [Chloroflexaceae bacterium]|nr:hypothetical protein [Chloroflexaceae bacterium]